jgi:hypothetical protein
MKKAILTIGLFTIVTALTSFAKPTTANVDNTVNTEIDGTGNQDTGGSKKVDFISKTSTLVTSKQIVYIDGTGNQDTGGSKKVD